MILFPHAKINLGLNVLFKRKDGFHEIETCMYPIPLFDVLEVIPNQTIQFENSGLLIDGNFSDNLIFRAYQLLNEKFHLPNVYIHLLKQIPMGGGMGGGSSDATYMLKALNHLFNLQLSNKEISDFASQLGSDCPFFIEPTPKIATGRGEILKPISLDLSGFYLKLIFPGIHISTKEAYSKVRIDRNPVPIEEILKLEPEEWNGKLSNAFEFSAFSIYPQLKRIKESLYEEGALYASMTGSGSTIFGLFKNKPDNSKNTKIVLLK